jgi:gliding motility-associated-like protein
MKNKCLWLCLALLGSAQLLWAQTSGCGITVDAGPDKILCFPGGSVQLNGSISGDYLDFSWSPPTGLVNPNSLGPTAIVNQTITYALTGRSFDPANNLVVNGDFSQGDVGFSSDYTNDPMQIFLPGFYALVTSPDLIYSNFPPCDDHSPGQGNLMLVNGSTNSNDDIWCQTIPVTPNTEYVFGAWVGTIVPFNLAQISFLINGQPLGPPIFAPSEVCSWTQFWETWNSGSATTATICIRDMNTANLGNDFGLDDIFFAPICPVTDSVTVSVIQPVAAAPVLQFLSCNTGELTLNAAGSSSGPGFSYLWTTQDGHIVSGATTLSPVVDETGTYTLTVTYSGGGVTCTAMTTVVVAGDPATPLAFATSQGTLDCNTPLVTVQGGGSSQGPGITYQWSSTNGNIVSDPNAQSIQVDAPGTYQLLVTNTVNGCTATATAQGAFNGTLPLVVVEDSLGLTCLEPEVLLDGTGSSQGPGIIYQWTTAGGILLSGDTTLTPLAGAPGSYTLLVTDTATGCADSATMTVLDQRELPFVAIDTPAAITCWDTLVVLDASASDPGLVVEWSTTGGHFTSGLDSLVVQVDAEGTYQLILLNPANGCVDTASIWVEDIRVVPGIVIAPAAVLTCVDSLTALEAQDTLGLPASYQWYTLDGLLEGPVDTLVGTAVAAGTYWLEARDSLSGCLAYDTVVVNIDTLAPVVDAGSDLILDCNSSSLSLSGSVAANSGFWNASWSTPDGDILSGDSTLAPLIGMAGTYVLQGWDAVNGCTAVDTVVVQADEEVPFIAIALPPVLSCIQDSVQLDASGTSEGPSYNYEWTSPDGQILSGANTLQPWVGQTGVYVLSVTDTNNGCTAQSSIEVGIDTLPPLAEAGAGGELTCADPTLTLDGSGSSQGAEYQVNWQTAGGWIASGADTYAPVAGQAGVYYIGILNTQNGCTAQDSVVVTGDLDLPLADAGEPVVLSCAAPQLSLDGSGSDSSPGLIYSWNTADGNLVSGADGLTPEVDMPGVYVLQVLDTTSGCAGLDTVWVSENVQAPALSLDADAVLTCQVNEVMIGSEVSGSTGPYAYFWSTGTGFINGPADQPAIQAASAGTYLLEVTDLSNGCVASGQVEVGIDTVAPVAQALVIQPLSCSVLSVLVSGNGSSTGPTLLYQWSTADGQISGPADLIEVQAVQPGTYTLTIIDTMNGCWAAASVLLEADTLAPAIEAGAGSTLTCSDPVVALEGNISGTGDWVIQWQTQSGNLIGGINTLSPEVDEEGWYILQVQDLANGCTATDSVWVEADQALPVVDIAVPGAITCQVLVQLLDGEGSSQGANFDLSWASWNGNILSGEQTLNPLVDQAGTYALTIQNLENGCVSSDSVQVPIDTLPPVIDAGPSGFFPCNATSFSLNSSVLSSLGAYEVQWTTLDGSLLSGVQTLSPLVGGPGAYSLLVTQLGNGCTAADEVVLLQQGIDGLVVQTVQPPCPGDFGQILVEQVEGGSPPYSFALENGTFQSEPSFEDLPPGTYELVVSDGGGCLFSQELVLNHPIPLLVQLPELIEADLGAVLTLQPQLNIPAGQISWVEWSPAAGLSCADCLNPDVQVMETATYTVNLADERGCVASAEVTIVVDRSIRLFAPNIFSPNADGINDVFQLYAREGQIGAIRNFQVWSRWGELVFQAANTLPGSQGTGWDGTISGRPASAGVYGWWAEVEWADGRVLIYHGNVTLLR